MTSHEFMMQIKKLQTDNGLTDGEVASACAGIVVSLCSLDGEDPVAFIQWAMREATSLGIPLG